MFFAGVVCGTCKGIAAPRLLGFKNWNNWDARPRLKHVHTVLGSMFHIISDCDMKSQTVAKLISLVIFKGRTVEREKYNPRKNILQVLDQSVADLGSTFVEGMGVVLVELFGDKASMANWEKIVSSNKWCGPRNLGQTYFDAGGTP